MTETTQFPTLSRGVWTLAHYLVERSPVPMPQIVGLHEDVLEVARVAVTFPIPRTIYVVNEAAELQGMISADRLTSTVFDLIDNSRAASTLRSPFARHNVVKQAAGITAEPLMIPVPDTLHDEKNVAEA